jgi:hypothetical protein
METTRSYETSVYFQRTTLRYIPDDIILHSCIKYWNLMRNNGIETTSSAKHHKTYWSDNSLRMDKLSPWPSSPTHLVDNPVKHVHTVWALACYCRAPTHTEKAGPRPPWRRKRGHTHTHTHTHTSINNVLRSHHHHSKTIMTPKDF